MQPPFQLDFFNPPFRSASPQKMPLRAVPVWKYKAIIFASQIIDTHVDISYNDIDMRVNFIL